MAVDRKRIVELMQESGMGDDWIQTFMAKLDVEFPKLAEDIRNIAKEKANETTDTTKENQSC